MNSTPWHQAEREKATANKASAADQAVNDPAFYTSGLDPDDNFMRPIISEVSSNQIDSLPVDTVLKDPAFLDDLTFSKDQVITQEVLLDNGLVVNVDGDCFSVTCVQNPLLKTSNATVDYTPCESIDIHYQRALEELAQKQDRC